MGRSGSIDRSAHAHLIKRPAGTDVPSGLSLAQFVLGGRGPVEGAPIGSTVVTCSSEQILNSAGTPSSATSVPTRRLVLVKKAISGCRTSYDWPLDMTSRNGLN